MILSYTIINVVQTAIVLMTYLVPGFSSMVSWGFGIPITFSDFLTRQRALEAYNREMTLRTSSCAESAAFPKEWYLVACCKFRSEAMADGQRTSLIGCVRIWE